MSIPNIDITAPDEAYAAVPVPRDEDLIMPGPEQWPPGAMACLKCLTSYGRNDGMRQRADFLMSGECEPVALERSVKAAPEAGRFTFGPWQEVGRSRVKFTVKIGPRPTGPQTADGWIAFIEEHKPMAATTADIVRAIVQRLGLESEATYNPAPAIRGQGQLARALFIAMNEAEVVRRCELREAGKNVRNLLTDRCRAVVTTMMADPAYAKERQAAERLASRTWSARRVGR